MKRLTTDIPENNIETSLNLFYVKDKWVWVRGGGPAPKYEDVSLCDYIRMIAKEHKLDIELSSDDDEISNMMAELLFDGTDTIEGIVATLFTVGWAFAEIRQRLKDYEDTGLEPEEIKARLDPPNQPLTLEKLTARAVEEARSADREKIASMEKQLASASDGDLAAFQVHYEAWQEHYNKMMGHFALLTNRNHEKVGNIRNAIRAAVERMVMG